MANSFATPWTEARQAPLSMGFPRQEILGGLISPFPGDLPNPGIKPISPALRVASLPLSHQGSPIQPIFPLNFLEHMLHILHGMVFSY